MDDIKHKYDENVENNIVSIVIEDEYQTAKSAKGPETADFESTIDMLELRHSEKDYEWMSDIEYPVLATIVTTDASGWGNQYFQSRSFVDVKLEGTTKLDQRKCEAAKKCINQNLNNRYIFHYHKYIRGRTINALNGQISILNWWEQKINPRITGYNERKEELDVDNYGNKIAKDGNGNPADPTQEPAYRTVQEPIYDEDVVIDRYNYDVIDPRNLFTDSKYCYSPQEKNWITIRSDPSYEELKSKEKEKGYFNLDLVKEAIKGTTQTETDTSRETYNLGEQDKESKKPVVKTFDRFLRFGKMWAIVTKRDEDGYAVEIKPGYDINGNILDKAELIETIIEVARPREIGILIRFQPNPFRDTKGNSYKPICRGWCYIHPTKDIGLSDGKYLREMQIATSDHFNMGSDRVKLATLPTLMGNKNALLDNTTIYFEPQHVMEVDNIQTDLQEFKIQDNIRGTIDMISMLENQAFKLTAVSPVPSMGQLPQQASTTATAVGVAEQKTSQRANYKSLTYEYTLLNDQYWMILQMTHAFAHDKTKIKMMGEDASFLDPDEEYSFTPVTSNIEVEYNRDKKLARIDQFIGRLVKIPNPNIWKLINYLLKKAFELFGDEFPDYKDFLLDEKAPPPSEKGGPGEGQVKDLGGPPTSNQMGGEMTMPEQNVRGI